MSGVSVATTYISTRFSMSMQKSGSQPAKTIPMANSMMYIGPVMTLFIAFRVPASGSLYWTISNILAIFQQMYINNHVIRKKATSEAKNRPPVTGGVDNIMIGNDSRNKENTGVNIKNINKYNLNKGGKRGSKESGKKKASRKKK